MGSPPGPGRPARGRHRQPGSRTKRQALFADRLWGPDHGRGRAPAARTSGHRARARHRLFHGGADRRLPRHVASGAGPQPGLWWIGRQHGAADGRHRPDRRGPGSAEHR